MENRTQSSEEVRKPYVRPQLVKQGRVEDLTQDKLEEILDCSKPIT